MSLTTAALISDPFNQEELGTVPEMGLAETKEAIEAAAKAFPAWSTTTAKVRTAQGYLFIFL
jgi:succinate-semialdehyde dehydrogenase/glutarate-semialdehyde dehydrogenase